MPEEQSSKAYNPAETESLIYKFWLDKKLFSAKVNSSKKSFCIMIPLPNITGSLHMGHALNNTIQDILTRFKRMQGFEALWMVGTDHAGIATQMVVEKQLAKEGKTKEDLGREKFVKKVWEWADTYRGEIKKQLTTLGVSVDWDRERFTLDEVCSKAVKYAFVKLFEKGCIYRDKFIINWCVKCKTAISDLEVTHEETEGNLYYVKYPLEDEKDFITIATTRPETILADTAVAVHPEDERYKDLISRKVKVPLTDRTIPIITDSDVDKEFGTGALKITPAHDPKDFEISRRHNLPLIIVIDQHGKMNESAGVFSGQDRFKAREAVTEQLKSKGLLEKIEPYRHGVGHCSRCQSVVEPYLSWQWFMDMSQLAKPAVKAVKDGQVRFISERFTKIYLEWMENIRPWCISRQLWWGHQMPIWKCENCGKYISYLSDPKECKNCKSPKITQESDVLDTWFSSSLWPMSTLGWPDNTPELNYFYPTSALVTARDIIFLWVARMIMMGLEFTGKIPFSDIYVHSTILNCEGKRMSKSLGTGVDPLELIAKYGTDAVRFGLVLETEQGQDIWFSEDRLEQARNFANKLWNASKFVMQNLENKTQFKDWKTYTLSVEDKWILSSLNRVIEETTKLLEEYDFAKAGRLVYDFFWDDFCDWYIEIAKLKLSDKKDKERIQKILIYVLDNFLRLIHPMMPFISEFIWEKIYGAPQKAAGVNFAPESWCGVYDAEKTPLIISDWPVAEKEFYDKSAEDDINFIRKAIHSIRNLRSEIKIPIKQKVKIIFKTGSSKSKSLLLELQHLVKELAQVEKLEELGSKEKKPPRALSSLYDDVEIFLPIPPEIDLGQEIKRLNNELFKIQSVIEQISKKLKNQSFLLKAPPQVVEKEKKKSQELVELKNKIQERLKTLVQLAT